MSGAINHVVTAGKRFILLVGPVLTQYECAS